MLQLWSNGKLIDWVLLGMLLTPSDYVGSHQQDMPGTTEDQVLQLWRSRVSSVSTSLPTVTNHRADTSPETALNLRSRALRAGHGISLNDDKVIGD
jgi:hypothetical protein